MTRLLFAGLLILGFTLLRYCFSLSGEGDAESFEHRVGQPDQWLVWTRDVNGDRLSFSVVRWSFAAGIFSVPVFFAAYRVIRPKARRGAAGPFPLPTKVESDTLELHIADWSSRSDTERAICLAILRGHMYVPEIAEHIGVEEDSVEAALPGLLANGLLRDGQRLLLH